MSGQWDWRMVFASGGMPSSHSSMCCAVTTSVALLQGLRGPLFPACLAFTLIVMYDAANVRYHAGIQAEVRTTPRGYATNIPHYGNHRVSKGR